MMSKKKKLSLYIHIPFCIQKCQYCDFLSFSSTEEDRNCYIQKLKKEIIRKSQWAQSYRVISVFFGGGTPSILSWKQMAELMGVIHQFYDIDPYAEITAEANPGTLTKEKLHAYRGCGINRLSIGLQSADNLELKRIGRIHTFEQFQKSYDLARKTGFENINIDLMSALPGQTMESYQKTLASVVRLEPEHISAYSLMIEEGTPLSENETLLKMLPDEELDRRMYQRTKEYLHEYGYERYEISNYSKQKKECIHNLVYWTGGDYLGFGLGASSYFQGQRFCNETDFKKYHGESEKQQIQILSKEDQMEEFMFLGMRLIKGISKKEFYDRFYEKIEDVYGDILKKQKKQGLILCEDDRIRLTQRGLDVSNYVFCDYLL